MIFEAPRHNRPKDEPRLRDATAADFPLIVARFHARRGFAEVGRQWLDEGRKQVSLQAAPTGGPP